MMQAWLKGTLPLGKSVSARQQLIHQSFKHNLPPLASPEASAGRRGLGLPIKSEVARRRPEQISPPLAAQRQTVLMSPSALKTPVLQRRAPLETGFQETLPCPICEFWLHDAHPLVGNESALIEFIPTLHCHCILFQNLLSASEYVLHSALFHVKPSVMHIALYIP